MMFSQIYIFTAAALVGICCQEITKVSVKKGSSISIPCLYESRYTNNDKYLCRCKTHFCERCQKVVQTDQTSASTKYSIFDDKLQHVFSVTIRDLTDEDNCFICGVSVSWLLDIKHKISLRISGVPSLYVDQQSITAVLGGSVTIMCRYALKQKFSWCKFGSRCISKSGQLNGLKVQINVNAQKAKVTMKGLKQEHSGWYFCRNNGFEMPIYLTILEEVTTSIHTMTAYVTNVTHWSTTEPSTTEPSTTEPSTTEPSTTEPSTTEPSTTICPNTTTQLHSTATQPVNDSQTVTEKDNLQQNQIPTTVIASTTTLVLVLSVIAGVSAWKMSKRCKSNATDPHTAQGAHTVQDKDVIYSDIIHTQHSSYNNKDELREACVIYSTIVTQDTSQQMTGPADGCVIYSTVSKK